MKGGNKTNGGKEEETRVKETCKEKKIILQLVFSKNGRKDFGRFFYPFIPLCSATAPKDILSQLTFCHSAEAMRTDSSFGEGNSLIVRAR
jgi:hypothetical protein